jgi:UDP-N-acetylglucosamine 2-epimerase (non-hydrolysing)
MKRIIILVGARPNFMKAAPVYNELKKIKRFKTFIVHSGQHYDREMSKIFFDELNLPKPKVYLGVGSGSHSEQTARVMVEFEKVCIKEKPDLVIVVGDVNTTLAGALTAAKLCIPVAHIEAGLRSFDRTMPEEINRLLTDQISDFLFTTCEDANQNLLHEGILKEKIFFVGNTMIDTLMKHLSVARKLKIREKIGLGRVRFGILTLHRPSNVDDKRVFQGILDAVSNISRIIPIVFPVHPRTYNLIDDDMQFLVYDDEFKKGIMFIEPLGYLEFLSLMDKAMIVLTDSGGIQEETTILGVPCITLRHNTERPITITQGTNCLVGTDPKIIFKEASSIIEKGWNKEKYTRPQYWDGKAAKRIADILKNI